MVFMLCSIEVPVIHWEPSMTFHNKVTNDKQVFCSVITFSPCSDCGLHHALSGMRLAEELISGTLRYYLEFLQLTAVCSRDRICS